MDTLSGIRILDLSHAIAAPSATNMLASLGAEVIKVEKFEGDSARALAPWAFETYNRNKRSIALNLKSAAGCEIVRRLARTCDMFVQSFRPGVTDGFGLDAATLATLNPRMIVVTFSAFGVRGPNASRRGVEAIIQAESGLARLQGSVLGGTMLVDEATGLVLANAMLAGILHRERTGVVRNVETSLFSTALYLQSPALLEASVTGVSMNQDVHRSRYPLTGMFDTADDPIYVAIYWDKHWEALCQIMRRPDLLTDDRFSTADRRSANQPALATALADEIRKRPQAEWLAALDEHGILAGAARDHHQVLASDQVTATVAVDRAETSRGEEGAFVRRAFRLGDGGADVPATPAPQIGEHTLDVLATLDIGTAEAERLRADGVVAWPAAAVSR